jgi:hypothetical protein
MSDQMVQIQEVMAAQADHTPLSKADADPELRKALQPDKDEPWEDMPPTKVDLEHARYALFVAEQQLQSFRAIKPATDSMIVNQISLVDQGLVQCEKLAKSVLDRVQAALRQNPATDGQDMPLWYVEESEGHDTHDHGMHHFEAQPLDIDSVPADDDAGTADADDFREFSRCVLLAEQLVMKLSALACERLILADSHTPLDQALVLASGQTVKANDINTLARKCDAYARCVRESVKAFGARLGKSSRARHAKLTHLMALDCLERCNGAENEPLLSFLSSLLSPLSSLLSSLSSLLSSLFSLLSSLFSLLSSLFSLLSSSFIRFSLCSSRACLRTASFST